MIRDNASLPILITCPNRVAPWLRAEVEGLDLPVTSEFITGVETTGSIRDVMRLNLHLRTGYRVLVGLDSFTAYTPHDLYDGARDMAWEELLPDDGYLSVVSSVNTPSINDSRFANVRLKDAIVDRIYEHKGRRPDSGPATDRAVIFLHWHGRRASIYLDTSGEPLTRRNYRHIPWKAPMHEALAATLILASRWDRESNFMNPMCGSGTLAIEAAMIALNRPAGFMRENFGFMHVIGYDQEMWERIRRDARRTMKKSLDIRIVASDISSEAVDAARRNADAAGVLHAIEFSLCDVAESPIATPLPQSSGIVMINPGYGMRMGEMHELEVLYSRIGDFFKSRCAGYTGYIFTGSPELARRVGLRPKRRLPFFNSTIDCRLMEYELYEGTRRYRDVEDHEVGSDDSVGRDEMPNE